MLEEDSFSLAPINFFQISATCCCLPDTAFPSLTAKNYEKFLLPNTSALCAEDHFAELAIGWNKEGLEAYAYVKCSFQESYYPDVSRGDSVELFIDTRDVKTSGFNTRFCHHFFFLPEAVEGHQAGELTRFRTEDAHDPCDPKDLSIKSQIKNNYYILNIFIPNQCLHGYDPAQFNRLGFSYRINRSSGPSQHFSVVSDEFQIEQQPSLWSSLKLSP